MLGALSVVGVLLRGVTTSPLWLDEALTVEIARLPVGDLLEALRRDGAPPLYYLLLHGWMKVFGTGDAAVRSLSAVFSTSTIPVLFLAVRRRAGHLPAVAAGVLLATSPFAIRYATEARMYALVALLVACGWLAIEAVLRGRRGATGAVAAVSGLLLLTHYWSFYLMAVVALLGALAWWRRWQPRPVITRIGVAAVLGGVVLFGPWVPTFVFQLGHTGTPWGEPPGPVEVVFTTLVDLGGGPHPEGQLIAALLVGLVLLGLTGRAIDDRRIEIDLRSVPGARVELAVAGATMLLGVGVGAVTASAWASRYNSVAFPLLVIAAALGVRALADRRIVAGLLVLVAALGVVGGARNAVTARTQAGQTASTLAEAGIRDGDWVVYCPDQLGPDAQRELPEDLDVEQVTFPDLDPPQLVDWVDYEARVRAADPAAFAAEVLRRAGDATVYYVWMSGYRTHGKACERINDALAGGSSGSRQLQDPDPDLFERHIVWVHPAGPQRAGA